MPWYVPWSDQIAKRVCKYLLQRYLGQFLQEKLSLDQLNVDLYKGIGTIKDVSIDVLALNDLAEQQNIPFSFTDGFIREISVKIPWSNLLSESCEIEAHGLELTVKYKERDKSKASMFESMWSSMSSSMQLAEDCLRSDITETADAQSQPIEGIERFAQTIDSVLTRIRVKFHKSVFRLEENPEESTTGVAIEAVVNYMEYNDEAGEKLADSDQGYEVPAFSTKKFYLNGVTFYSEEFSADDGDMENSVIENELEELRLGGNETPRVLEESKTDYSLPIARLAGQQEITLRFKQEGISGPKVELQVVLGALTVFASPEQIHQVLRFVKAMGKRGECGKRGKSEKCNEKPMEASDFRKIEEELMTGLNPAIPSYFNQYDAAGWCNNSMEDSQEFCPLNKISRYNESVTSSASSMASSTSSLGSNRSYVSSQPSYIDGKQAGQIVDSDAVVFHSRVSISSVALVILHDDVLTVTDSSPLPTPTSSAEMKGIAEGFFSKLGHFVVSGFGNKDFQDAKKLFLEACQRNHLRFLAAPVIIEGDELSTNCGSVFKGNLTASSVELLECLVEKDADTIGEYVQLLKFLNNRDEDEISKFDAQPNLRFNFRLSESSSRRKGRKISQPRSEFSFILQPFEMEFDLSILDRISPLLHMTFSTQNSKFSPTSMSSEDSATGLAPRKDFKFSSSFVIFKIRFPIPDLRPLHDMKRTPWWRRHVRSDALLLELTDLTMQTTVDALDPVKKYEMYCRDLIAKYQEADLDAPVPFVRMSADSQSNNASDGGRGCGWPRLVVKFVPEDDSIELDPPEHNLALHTSMAHSLITTLEKTKQREVSPFSFHTVIHSGDKADGEELVTPASKADMAEFLEVATMNSRLQMDVTCPTVSILLPTKHLYEVIYNRLTTDLILWKPSAPAKEHNDPPARAFDFEEDSKKAPTFSLCKSAIRYESDSDDDILESQYFSTTEIRPKRRAEPAKKTERGQSRITLNLNIGQGSFDLCLPVRDSQGNMIPGQVGELLLTVDEGQFFYVSGYQNKRDLDYMCVQANQFALYHNGLIGNTMKSPTLRSVSSPVPHYLNPTIVKMEEKACVDECPAVGTGSVQSLDMLTLAVRVSRDERCRSLKYFRVALGLRNSALRYLVSSSRSSWFNQIIDFFDVDDYPIAGYDPSTVLTELNLHLWNCNIDYRPLHLPLRSILNFGSFNISSNIASKTNSSTLRFIAEDASFFISNRQGHRWQSVNLQKDYICVMEMGLFELSLRLCEQSSSSPKVDLKATANGFLIRTCSDSAKAFLELLSYFASDGDLHNPDGESESQTTSHSLPTDEEHVLVSTEEEPAQLLSKSQVTRVNDLMIEAMQESHMSPKGNTRAYFTVEDHDIPELIENEIGVDSPILGSELVDDDNDEDGWESEFCIVDNEAGIGILPKSGHPEVRLLTDDPIRIIDNHFSLPTGCTDHLRSPKHFPRPVLQYTLREASMVWQMYGGSDFGPPPAPKHVNIRDGPSDNAPTAAAVTFSKSNPTVRFEHPSTPSRASKIHWKERGGASRRHDVLMELQLDKVQFQHEVYPDHTSEVSRQVLLVKDVEIRDRLASSQINKFLYQYCSVSKPKQAHAHMVVIKAVQMRADPKVKVQECCLKISLLPLRLNIDQDSILFLFQFFSDLAGDKDEEEEDQPAPSRNQTPTHSQSAVPVMSVSVDGKKQESKDPPAPPLIQLEEPRPAPRMRKKPKRESTSSSSPSQPLYFRCVLFSPDVPVKLDYQGKHVDLTHGPLAGLLLGLGQLNNSEFNLKRISHRHGLLGFEKLLQYLLNEWSSDLKRNQLPGLLGGVGPMHSLVQLFQGVRDLFWLPIEQYQKDGRIVRGFQRGANSFTTSSAMAVLELTSRLIQLVQATAETAYDMVSPGPSVRARRNVHSKRRQYSQPADIREGVANAILVVRDGIGETAQNIIRVASEEHEQKGVTGAVGGVLRQIPPTVVKPIILATEATNNVIGGVRSQLVPDARKEAVDKWRGQST